MLLLSAINLIISWATAHSVTSTLVVATLVFLFLRWLLTRRKNFPRGPWGVPFFGYIPLMFEKPHIRLNNLSKKYGEVFSLSLGGRPTVILNSFSSIKEAFSSSAYGGRPPDSVFEIIKQPGDPPSPDGPEWTKIRRFTLHLFRDLGFGKEKLEEQMREEVMQFLQEVKDTNGEPIYLKQYVMPSVTNNICILIFGKRFERGCSGLKPFTKPSEPNPLFCSCGILMYIPFAQRLIRLAAQLSWDENLRAFSHLENLVKNEIDSHIENMDSSSSYKDFIDGFLHEMEKHKNNKNNVAFTEPSLRECIGLLLGAGSDTVATTIEWACLVMTEYPEVQRKVQNEIDEVVGRERIPCWEDHSQLPYVQAVLMEVQRWITLVPVNLLRYTLEDTKLGGFDIPKGTTVLANLWAVHHDPEGWKDPENFLPERFLSADGKTVVKPENYIPFSYGKRSCLGEPLGIQEPFLYFTAIMQTFSVHTDKGTKADLDGILSVVYGPKKQDLCFVPRD